MALHSQVSKKDGSSPNDYQSYVCSHCDTKVTGAVIGYINSQGIVPERKWLFCPNCLKGTVTVGDSFYPSSRFGSSLDGLPSDIEAAYDEARNCMSVNAYTASELVCRKILMHVAVDKGADEGQSFASYLKFLETEGFITPSIKEWADLIRQHGNQTTHLLDAPSRERAELTLIFTSQLLRIVYEMEHLKNKYTASDSEQ